MEKKEKGEVDRRFLCSSTAGKRFWLFCTSVQRKKKKKKGYHYSRPSFFLSIATFFPSEPARLKRRANGDGTQDGKARKKKKRKEEKMVGEEGAAITYCLPALHPSRRRFMLTGDKGREEEKRKKKRGEKREMNSIFSIRCLIPESVSMIRSRKKKEEKEKMWSTARASTAPSRWREVFSSILASAGRKVARGEKEERSREKKKKRERS